MIRRFEPESFYVPPTRFGRLKRRLAVWFWRRMPLPVHFNCCEFEMRSEGEPSFLEIGDEGIIFQRVRFGAVTPRPPSP